MHSWGPFYPPFVSLAILVTIAWILVGPIIAVWARDLRLVALLPLASGASACAWVAVHNKRLAATAGAATHAANSAEAMVLLLIAFVSAAIVSFVLAILPYRSERVRRVPMAPYLIVAAVVIVLATYFYPVVCFSAAILVAVLTIVGLFLPAKPGPDLRGWLFAMTAGSVAGIVVTYMCHHYFMGIATGAF